MQRPTLSSPLSFLFLFVWLVLLFLSASSCKEKRSSKKPSAGIFEKKKFDEDDFAERLSASLNGAGADSETERFQLLKAYSATGYYPLWLNETGDITIVQNFLHELDSISGDGLSPEKYRLAFIKKQLAAYKESNPSDLNLAIMLDTALTASYLQASHDLLFGAVLPKMVDSLWFHVNDSTWTIDTAINQLKDGNYFSLDYYKSKVPTYSFLKNALYHFRSLDNDSVYNIARESLSSKTDDSEVISIIQKQFPWIQKPFIDTLDKEVRLWIYAYQQNLRLRRTAKLDSATLYQLKRPPGDFAKIVAANMERIRWMPQSLGNEYLLVDVPLMELFVRKDGYEAVHMNVVVGKPIRQTPSLNAKLSNVVFNPPWGVPPTILKQDVLPGMQDKSKQYLKEKNLKIYDHKGNLVDPSLVNASNYKKYVFRQPPGDDNALGYVKFNLPNKWDIYLHDTPHREDFEKYDRARSSGCIRLAEPRELAQYILYDLNGRPFEQFRIDSIIKTQKTKWEILKNKVPVHIVYLTAFEDVTGTGVRFARDIYHRDAPLIEALR
jgi:L,D-transpeptidase YcbB